MQKRIIDVNLNKNNETAIINRIQNNVYKKLPNITEIDKIHTNDLSYSDFFEKYLSQNLPVIINGISDDWECMNWINCAKTTSNSINNISINNGDRNNNINNGHNNWDQQYQNCDINFNYLESHVNGNIRVPIANCHKNYYNSHEKAELNFSEYLNYWRERIENDRNNSSTDANGNVLDDKLLYLKDWHLKREMPNYEFYMTPIYFSSDWLNEYCVEKGLDDYRFVYMGPKQTWTPFHVDVFTSYSWSTNISGRKKWIFLLPGEEQKLKDSLGNTPFSIDDKSILSEKNVRFVEVIQNAGETVFVPSGWYHQVWNMSETISINHNWFNGCNIFIIWSALYETYQQVLSEIDDCREMDNFDEHCQLMLKTVFGMNFDIFLDLLNVIAENRIKALNGCSLVNGVEISQSHARFDLIAIYLVLRQFKNKCSSTKWAQQCTKILSDIYLFINTDIYNENNN